MSNIATPITVETTVAQPAEKAWKIWTTPDDIVKWNSASDDWHTPKAESDLRDGGRFVYRMEAKDRSFGFDFGGTYTKVVLNELLKYKLDDGRTASVAFKQEGNQTRIFESFDPESINPIETQQTGWQSILDNFKKYADGM